MINTDIWPLALEVLRALGSYYYPAMGRAATEAGLGERDWYLLIAILTIDPRPVSSQVLGRRNPYTAAAHHAEHLEALAEAGALLPDEKPGEYVLSEAGRSAVGWIIHAAYEAMAELYPLPRDEQNIMSSLLRELVFASLDVPEPPGKWSLQLSRKTDPGDTQPKIVLIDQYLSDLAAYRDDCHLASWETHDISGQAWEAFTLLWRGDASSLFELSQRLERRGHSKEIYRQAMLELIDRGWVSEEDSGSYALTAHGRKVRQDAEDLTDRYFYTPWARMDADQLVELKQHLIAMWDGLR